jgi:hypothetical protein
MGATKREKHDGTNKQGGKTGQQGGQQSFTIKKMKFATNS